MELANFSGLIFWPRDTTTWYDFFIRLFFEGETSLALTVISITAFGLYRVFGSPLDVSAQQKQVEREEAWSAHNDRFKPKHHPKWLQSGPAATGSSSEVVSWSGTGSDAGVRKSAVLNGDRSYPKRTDTKIAEYNGEINEAKAMHANESSSSSSSSKKKSVANDGNNQRIARQNSRQDAINNSPTPPISTITINTILPPASVMIVGDPATATHTFVTHHDICTNPRGGLLNLSIEFIKTLNSAASTNNSRPISVGEFHSVDPILMCGITLVLEGGRLPHPPPFPHH